MTRKKKGIFPFEQTQINFWQAERVSRLFLLKLHMHIFPDSWPVVPFWHVLQHQEQTGGRLN